MSVTCLQCAEPLDPAVHPPGSPTRCPACGQAQIVPLVHDPAKARPTVVAVEPKRRERSGLFEESRVQGLAVLLLALSAGDLFTTHLLLRTSSRFYESNPVAMWFFSRWNMAGMTLFKFGGVALVIALSEFVERKKAGRGKFVLIVGCIATIYAIYKGLSLYLAHG